MVLFRELCSLDDFELYLVIAKEADIPDYAGETIRAEAFCSREGESLIMVSHYTEDFPACITNHLRLR